MNPCINCKLDNEECHESGFANHCDPWVEWKTEHLLWRGKERIKNLRATKGRRREGRENGDCNRKEGKEKRWYTGRNQALPSEVQTKGNQLI